MSSNASSIDYHRPLFNFDIYRISDLSNLASDFDTLKHHYLQDPRCENKKVWELTPEDKAEFLKGAYKYLPEISDSDQGSVAWFSQLDAVKKHETAKEIEFLFLCELLRKCETIEGKDLPETYMVVAYPNISHPEYWLAWGMSLMYAHFDRRTGNMGNLGVGNYSSMEVVGSDRFGQDLLFDDLKAIVSATKCRDSSLKVECEEQQRWMKQLPMGATLCLFV